MHWPLCHTYSAGYILYHQHKPLLNTSGWSGFALHIQHTLGYVCMSVCVCCVNIVETADSVDANQCSGPNALAAHNLSNYVSWHVDRPTGRLADLADYLLCSQLGLLSIIMQQAQTKTIKKQKKKNGIKVPVKGSPNSSLNRITVLWYLTFFHLTEVLQLMRIYCWVATPATAPAHCRIGQAIKFIFTPANLPTHAYICIVSHVEKDFIYIYRIYIGFHGASRPQLTGWLCSARF